MAELSILQDPTLTPFLPMIYVAWADGYLSDGEIEAICTEVSSNAAVGGSCQQVLGDWLNPTAPPTAAQLQALLRGIQSRAAKLEPTERRTLTELGLAIAEADTSPTVVEREALERIENALGVLGPEATRQILLPERPVDGALTESDEPSAASFDVKAMQAIFDGDYPEKRRAVRELLSQPHFAYQYALPKSEYRELVLSWCREIASAGFGALSYPEVGGGQNDTEAFVAAFETIAEHDLSLLIKFGVQFGLFGGSISQLGTEHHHREFLPQVGTLELPGCFAMTETGHGSNVRDIETTATFDLETDEFVIHTPNPNARKDYIGNAAAHGQMATVFAQLEVQGEAHGVHALLVPIRNRTGETLPGVTIEDCGEKMGLNGVDNGRLYFDQVRVPRAHLLDRFASVSAEGEYTSPIASSGKRFFTMLGTLVGGRVSIAMCGLVAAKSALAIAVRYGDRRRQFGAAGEAETQLLDYRTHQLRLLPRVAASYAFDFALKNLAKSYAAADPDARHAVEATAAGLKAMATWHATDTIQTARECCGGKGYLAENRFAALKADTDIFTTFEGDNTVLLQLVAKALLTGYKQQFTDLTLMTAARYVAGQANTAIRELNPVIKRLTDPDHLRSDEFQLDAFGWREDHLVATVARRLKKRIDGGMDSYHAFIECQDHLVTAAKAHVERLVLEQFVEGIAKVSDAAVQGKLEELRSLYALWRIETDRGWFQEHGYLGATKTKAIRREVKKLCLELRPEAVALVDSFGIPDALLAAPIAFDES